MNPDNGQVRLAARGGAVRRPVAGLDASSRPRPLARARAQTYYWNSQTGESTYSRPHDFNPGAANATSSANSGLPQVRVMGGASAHFVAPSLEPRLARPPP